MTHSLRSIRIGLDVAHRALLVSLTTVLMSGLIPAVCANQRQSTTDTIIIPVHDHTPDAKGLEHHDLFARARLRVLPNGVVAAVTFDRSSGIPKLDAAAARYIKGWKIPRSLVNDSIVVPIIFTLSSRLPPLTKEYQPLPGERIHIP
jgi:TonB family protein